MGIPKRSPKRIVLQLTEEDKANLRSREWRLNNLYWILDSTGKRVRFKLNWAQRKLLKDLHFLNVVLKARQLGMCYHPDMRVLTADLNWVRIEDLTVGQKLVCVDENIPGGRGKARKMRLGEVEGLRYVFEESFKLTMDNGVELVATGGHRHLCKRRGGTEAIWRKVEDCVVGDEIRYVTKPWPDERTFEDGWMSGLYDGEGSLRRKERAGAELCVSQVQGNVLERARQYLTSNGYTFREEIDTRKPGESSKFGNKNVHKLVVGRCNELFKLIGITNPARFKNREWWQDLDLPGKKSGQAWSRIVSIESLGKQKMVDLQTSRKTFICEGFVSHNSSFIDILMLDVCLFNSNVHCGIVADTLDNAAALLRNKIMYAYNNLPQPFKDEIPITVANTERVEFKNGSSIDVGTSLRGGTYQWLHISELGKIAAKFPEKAEEIRSGALNTVAAGQVIIIESTAEGQDGLFYEICDEAAANVGPLTKLDFRFHFFPWWMDSKYQLDEPVHVDDKHAKYFRELEALGIKLTDKQKGWYVKKAKQQKNKMKREFPSTPSESFEVSIEGAYYTDELLRMQEESRIGYFPHDPSQPVDTWWDIGQKDATTIVFVQDRYVMGKKRKVAIDYYEMTGEKRISHYIGVLKSKPYRYRKFLMPHDIRQEHWGMEKSRIQQFLDAGVQPDIVIDHYIEDRIEAAANLLDVMCIDATFCEQLLKCLRNYRRTWNDKKGIWDDEPYHNWASHGADALGYGAVAFKQEADKVQKEEKEPRGVMQMRYNELGDLSRSAKRHDRI